MAAKYKIYFQIQLVVREIEIKVTLKYPFIPIRQKKSDNSSL